MRGPSLVIALARVLILLSLQALSDIHFLFVNRPLPVLWGIVLTCATPSPFEYFRWI